ncbi:MAG: family 43 glycosylhydrolase [Verrucomicrobia bacterium]|nr:family 43 glycosylhydrolase [Verrucomicrobiota bacterium]
MARCLVVNVLLLLHLIQTSIAAPKEVTYSNPVIAGDYPDPSIIRVGRSYWATATTSEWAPLFPLLHSNDLVNWSHLANVFAHSPTWSAGNYWAPEISEFEGRFYVYYVARKKGGPLSIAVATAPRPEGPYEDHGPLVGQDAGSIDPVTTTDENGKRYLLWKEDGNSRKQPTPIWAQELSGDGTRLTGEMKEIIRNDAPWEGSLVEGPFVVQRNGWFYLFYSGNACCGRGCNYALGVARSKKLLGPWEKNPANPILAGNEKWKCPGHGSIVTHLKGRNFLLYHAYHAQDFISVGRQALLDEIQWETNAWPTINQGRGPSLQAPAPHGYASFNGEHFFFDDFKSANLLPQWHWPHANAPVARLKSGALELMPNPDDSPQLVDAVLALRTTRGDYEATTLVDLQGMRADVTAGLAAYGDAQNALGIAAGNGKLTLWRRRKDRLETLAEEGLSSSAKLYLRMRATTGRLFRFATSIEGRTWNDVGPTLDIEGDFLPPWDRGVRVALTAGGAENSPARFDWFRVDPVVKR